MKAITLHQPWASAIMAGVKRWENRTWMPKELKTEPLLWLGIHAGKGTDTDVDLEQLRKVWPDMPEGDWPRGLLGFACFDGAGHISVFPEARTDPWATGPKVWHVREVLRIDQPIPVKGAQGIWALDKHLRIPLFDAEWSVPRHFRDITADLKDGPVGTSTAGVLARVKWVRELRGMTIHEVECQLRFRHFLFWRGRCLQSLESHRCRRWAEHDIEVLADIYDVPADWLFYGPSESREGLHEPG